MLSLESEKLISDITRPMPLPFHFKRRHPKAYRFTPYSRKVMRQLDIYTRIVYELWVRLEWDCNIVNLNERVTEVAVPGDSGVIFKLIPAMVTVDKNRNICIHVILEENVTDNSHGVFCVNAEQLKFVNEFTKRYGILTAAWSPDQIQGRLIELENLEHLLRYTCKPEMVICPVLRDQIVLVIRQSRKTTVGALMDSLPEKDPQWIIRVLAAIIQEGLIYSDISRYPFGYATEISAYHDFA